MSVLTRFLRLLLASTTLLAVAGPGFAAAPAAPWRLQTAAALPAWLTLTVQHRARYESIDGQFRAGGSGGDQGLALRTLAAAEARRGDWRAGAELLDARLLLDDAGTPVDTGQVNAAELLQGYLAWSATPGGGAVTRAGVKLGRQTIDLGSRRLIARNAFRNTINAFTGVDASLETAAGVAWRAFAVMPVMRRPDARAALAEDAAGLDEEDTGSVLWALALSGAAPPEGTRIEGYVVGLHESDDRQATRNRRLVTPGVRFWRDPAPGRLDFELESMLQFGSARATAAATDTAQLDHFAHFQHLQVGRTFAVATAPRLLAQFDYASGDADPADGDSGRFDTLFSARRFDFGPTGLWGPFARANVITPGWRVQFQPLAGVQASVGHRAYWLARARDAWTAAGVRDASGRSGRYLGQQVEWSVAWAALPGNLTVEAGGAVLFAGGYPRRAPAAPGGDGGVLYVQTQLSF